MKKIILTIVALLFMCGTAISAERITVTKNAAGTISHVTAYVTESGQTVFLVDSLSNVTFYVTTLVQLSGSSIYFLGGSGAGYYAIYNSKNSVTGTATLDATKLTGSVPNASIPDPILSGVSTTQITTGGIFAVNLTSSETLSGNTVYGGAISNLQSSSEVTGTASGVTDGMCFSFENAGNTAFTIGLDASDTLLGVPNWSSGNSVLYIHGYAGTAYGFLRYIAPNKWILSGASVTTRNK